MDATSATLIAINATGIRVGAAPEDLVLVRRS